jgi:GDPmannose 4,6-dehydratase
MKTQKYSQVAMVTGVTGQDGSYLAELLLSKGYQVVGLYRRTSSNHFERLNHIINNPNFQLEEFDLTDPATVSSCISRFQPNEFYNLAAQSHVGTSFKQPSTTMEINCVGVINILEAIKNYATATKFYQASTSEMFGRNFSTDENGNRYQDEDTELLPQSPYGVSKLAAHRMVQLYREGYGLFACSGILFNHESPRRGENFVTRKITKYLGKVVSGIYSTDTPLNLGNINIHRDWGHAKDYVRAMWMMLQYDNADDYVVSTGQTRTVLDFLKASFELVGLDYKRYVQIDPTLYRPAEVDYLKGQANKAKTILGWEPEISFQELVEDMVNSDIKEYSHV